MQRAFENDGVHPKAAFALYLIGVAMSLTAWALNRLHLGEFRQTGTGSPILMVVADGWNHEGCSQNRLATYNRIKADLLNTSTVGEMKRNYPLWRRSFYDFCSKMGSAAS